MPFSHCLYPQKGGSVPSWSYTGTFNFSRSPWLRIYDSVLDRTRLHVSKNADFLVHALDLDHINFPHFNADDVNQLRVFMW